MKLFGFAMVKNECDIIEQFVRVNLRVLDELHIIDDGSNDGTNDILSKLKTEGLNVTVYYHRQQDVQQQSYLMTSLLRMTSNAGWDHAFLLDGDEFLLNSRDELEADLVAHCRDHFGLLGWRTFVPHRERAQDCAGIDLSGFAPRRQERIEISKVVIPRHLLSEHVQVSVGNHFAVTSQHFSQTHRRLESRLGHVPIRSIDQLVNKAVIGAHLMNIKQNRLKGETTHWETMAKAIRAKRFRLTFSDLQEFAYGFPGDPLPVESSNIDVDGPGLVSQESLYSDLARINISENFDRFCLSLVLSLIHI